MRGRLLGIAISVFMVSCGLVTISTSTTTTKGGGEGGGGAGKPSGKKAEYDKGDAAWYVQNGDGCQKLCLEGVPECVNDCVEMRKAYTTTGKDIPKTCSGLKDYNEDNWKECYDGSNYCLDKCYGCKFPRLYVPSKKGNWYDCICPPGTGYHKQFPDECLATKTIAEINKQCEVSCRQKKSRCVKDALDAMGYPVTKAKEQKAEKKCKQPYFKCCDACYTRSDNGSKLIEASKTGNAKKVRALLKKASPFTSDDNLTTPIHYAAMNGHLDIIKIFVEEESVIFTGVDFYGNSGAWLPKDLFGKTPLDYAVENGHEDVAAYLRAQMGL